MHHSNIQVRQKMSMEEWSGIKKILLPLYGTATTPSKLNSAKKWHKLNDFESLNGSKWDDLMELFLEEFQIKQSPGELISANQPTRQK